MSVDKQSFISIDVSFKETFTYQYDHLFDDITFTGSDTQDLSNIESRKCYLCKILIFITNIYLQSQIIIH